VKVVWLNVGLPRAQHYGREVVWTAGAKRPVPNAVLRFHAFEGDGQADRLNHENLRVSGAVENEVCIGDVFRMGKAVVQVSQPRTPCGKLAGKNGQRLLARWVAQTGYTGFYMQVLSEGPISIGDAFELVERHPDRISITAVNDIVFRRSEDERLIERLANLPELGADGRALFAERLERLGREKKVAP
jgi:MOSC domain-containing protein YiiM